MLTYKYFAIVGAGLVGEAIAKELIKYDAEVIVLTRPESSTKDLPQSVQQIRVSFTDVEAVAATLIEHKIEVVIASLNPTVLLTQIPLADAAKKAGVRLFVPSEFGFSTVGARESSHGDKLRVAEYLKDIGLPSTRIFTGLFYSFFSWIVQYKDGKIHIIGSGNKRATFTDLNDIVGYTAYITTHLPPAKLENKILRIQGDNKTLLEVAALYGDKAKVVHVDELPEYSEFADRRQRLIEAGKGSTGYDGDLGRNVEGEDAAGVANALWEGHVWAKFTKESLGL